MTLLYQKRNGFLLFLPKKVPQKRTLCEHFWDILMFYKANSKERKEVRPLLPAHGDRETRRGITPEPALIFDAEVIKGSH
ncbi:hypothetical protein DV714_14030 [Parageobacillus thermoglucosidasius]|nr:hypothetical protein DV714_14030 [Parageobacillus thermoglucosidasius]